MDYMGTLRSKRVAFSAFRYMKGYVTVIRGTDEFHGFIKLRKRSIFVMDSYWNDSAFTAGKKGAKFQERYVKGVPFLCKNCICTGLEVGAESPCMEICCVTHSLPVACVAIWMRVCQNKLCNLQEKKLKLVENIKIKKTTV